MTLPLNGLKNFNFYYSADGNGFLSGGGYRVNYLNSSGSNCYGSGDIAVYSPNGGHTNGVEVRPFAGTLTEPLGVYGTVLAEIPGGGGATTPLVNATVALADPDPLFLWKAKTNGNGYFSIYYSSFAPGEFLPWNPAYDAFKVSGVLQFDRSLTCVYEHLDYNGVIWMPNGDYLTSFPMGTLTLRSETPGCEP